MKQDNQLDVPRIVAGDPNAIEVLRVWIADSNQQFCLRAGVWEDPAAWGLMLADLARHIVETYEPATAVDREDVLKRIRMGFEAELQNPTEAATEQ